MLSDELIGKARQAITAAEARDAALHFNRDFVRDLIDDLRKQRFANADLRRQLEEASHQLATVTEECVRLSADLHRNAADYELARWETEGGRS